MNDHLMEIELPRNIWRTLSDKNKFYSDLDSMLSKLECELISKREISTILRRKGLKIDWFDYGLTFYVRENRGIAIRCPACSASTTVFNFWWASLLCLQCKNNIVKDIWQYVDDEDNPPEFIGD